MAYTREDFTTKKAFKEAVASDKPVECYQPGPFGPHLGDGVHAFEGPHYPKPHRWYARARVAGGLVVSVLD